MAASIDNGSISPIQYKYINITSTMKTAAQAGQSSWDSTSAPGYFGQSTTSVDPEIPIYDGNYSGGWWAQVAWSCSGDGTYSGNEVSHMKFDISDMNGLSASEKKLVAAHEFGHAYGLGHTYSGCRVMRQGQHKFTCGISGPASNDVAGVDALY